MTLTSNERECIEPMRLSISPPRIPTNLLELATTVRPHNCVFAIHPRHRVMHRRSNPPVAGLGAYWSPMEVRLQYPDVGALQRHRILPRLIPLTISLSAWVSAARNAQRRSSAGAIWAFVPMYGAVAGTSPKGSKRFAPRTAKRTSDVKAGQPGGS
ncbi:hypothetical protein CC2G_003675 [Coprinopsis cinerea AmutBmut pab1-1]|nr:hypothetical protein CC2G_003675 [Coprinopsis cinerea AmutBmut pab1-1]